MSVDTARGQKRASNDSPVAGIPGGCELPGVGENRTPELLKNSFLLTAERFL